MVIIGTTGIILLIIAAVLSSILFLRVRLSVVYSRQVELTARVLFFKIAIVPQKEKKVRLRRYKRKRFDADREKQRRSENKKANRSAAKKLKKQQKNQAGADADKATDKAADKSDKPSLIENISFFAGLIFEVIKRFFGHLRIDAARIHVSVGGEDAAKTAIMYGFISQAAAYVIEILDSVSNFKVARDGEVAVVCDYTSGKTDADVDITFSVRVWAVLDVALRAGIRFLTRKMKAGSGGKRNAESGKITKNTGDDLVNPTRENINNKTRKAKKMGENKINDIIKTSLESLRSMVDANTVIGNAIATPGGTMVIPVSKVTAGFASGGLDFDGKNQSAPRPQNFGGGNGTGLSVTPVGFLVISPDGAVELLNINANAQSGAIEQIGDLVERSPEIIEKLKAVFKKNKKSEDEKNAGEENTEEK